MKKKAKIETKRCYTYGEFLKLFPFCSSDHQKELLKQLEGAKKPTFFAGAEVPDDLNLVTYGMLDDLSNISQSGLPDPMAQAIAKILCIDTEKVYEANVFDVFGISKWIGSEVERINKLFKGISPRFSSQEIAAGVKAINFGSFGVLDWYSHRQGIADQNEVRDVAWIRIFTCMKNDNIKAEYEKRLNQVYSKQYSNGSRSQRRH